MDIEKLKKEIQKNLISAKGERQSKIDSINKSYDEKILKLETERKTKLLNVPGNDEDIKKLEKALTALGGALATDGEHLPFPKPDGERVPFPTSYAEAKTWKSKIIFALSQIDAGTNDGVISKLIELDKSFDADKSGKSINLTLSNLKGEGIITTIGKLGKKDIYTLA